jgi:hypothetical protein
LGLEGELELLKTLKKMGFKCIHRLEQRKITDFIAGADDDRRKQCELLLKRNRMLPRRKLTYQIDIMGWADKHWAALAIEEKRQHGARKVLDLDRDSVVIKALCKDGIREYKDSGRDLFLQCSGEALLGKAFCTARGIDTDVLPVGAIDYDIQANEEPADVAYHRGVFFVHNPHFRWFVEEFLQEKKWIKKIVRKDPRIMAILREDVAS